MRNALILVLLAVLAAACGKKQPPAAPQPPPPAAEDADKAGAPADEAPETTPTMRKEDPDTGGE
jgi:hypothetical protein